MSSFSLAKQPSSRTFKNGLRLVHQKPPHNIPMASIQVFCNVGSAFEVDRFRGIAHAVEHMVFKGTRDQLPKDIFEAFDKVGAYFNAYTTKRYTCYFLKCDHKYVGSCLKTLGDMLMRSSFPKREYTKELNVIREENMRDENDIERIVYQLFCEMAFADDSFRHPVDNLRYHKNGSPWKIEKLRSWYKHYYRPEQMVVSVVCAQSMTSIAEMLEETVLVNAVPPAVPISHGLAFPSKQVVRDYPLVKTRTKKGLANTSFMIGFPCCNQYDDDKYHCIMLTDLLNGLSGRLALLLREKHGLAYKCKASCENEEFSGYFAVQIECSNENLMDRGSRQGALSLTIALLRSLKTKGVSEKELTYSKERIRGKTLATFEDIATFAEYNGYHELVLSHEKKFVPIDKVHERHFDTITVKQMHKLIQTLFVPERLMVAVVSNHPPTVKEIETERAKFR